MPRTSSLAANTLTLAISNVGTALLSFALAALIGRGLGEEGLGIYAVALAWVMPLALVAEFGLGTLLTRELAAAPERQGAWVRAAVTARQIMGSMGVLALIVAAPRLTDDPRAAIAMQLSAPLIVIQPLYSTYTAVFRARGAMWPIPWLNIGMLLAQVILTFVVLSPLLTDHDATATATDQAPLFAVLAINTLTSAGQLAAAWAIYRRRYYVSPGRERLALRPLLRQSWHFGLAAVFAAVQLRVGLILLESLAGAGAAGYFAAGNRFFEAARLLPNAFFGALFPTLSVLAADPGELRRMFRRALALLGVYGAGAGLLLALTAPLLLEWVFGASFEPAVPALQWLALALVFNLLRGARTLHGYARGREAWVNAVNLMVILVQAVVSLWAIPGDGAAGAALAFAVAEGFGLALLSR